MDNERPKDSDLPKCAFDDEAFKAEISLRLKDAVRNAGGNKAVSAKSGIPLKTLGNLLAGQPPTAVQLYRLAHACQLPLDWFVGKAEVSAAQLGDEFVLVPRYNVQASAGNGSLIYSEQIVDYLAFKADWINKTLHMNPEWLLLIEAIGDSMEGTISDGDLLLINTHEPRIRENAVYAINVNGNLLVKRVQLKLDGTVVVKSDNPKYDPEIIKAPDTNTLRVIGQVIWHGGLMR